MIIPPFETPDTPLADALIQLSEDAKEHGKHVHIHSFLLGMTYAYGLVNADSGAAKVVVPGLKERVKELYEVTQEITDYVREKTEAGDSLDQGADSLPGEDAGFAQFLRALS